MRRYTCIILSIILILAAAPVIAETEETSRTLEIINYVSGVNVVGLGYCNSDDPLPNGTYEFERKDLDMYVEIVDPTITPKDLVVTFGNLNRLDSFEEVKEYTNYTGIPCYKRTVYGSEGQYRVTISLRNDSVPILNVECDSYEWKLNTLYADGLNMTPVVSYDRNLLFRINAGATVVLEGTCHSVFEATKKAALYKDALHIFSAQEYRDWAWSYDPDAKDDEMTWVRDGSLLDLPKVDYDSTTGTMRMQFTMPDISATLVSEIRHPNWSAGIYIKNAELCDSITVYADGKVWGVDSKCYTSDISDGTWVRIDIIGKPGAIPTAIHFSEENGWWRDSIEMQARIPGLRHGSSNLVSFFFVVNGYSLGEIEFTGDAATYPEGSLVDDVADVPDDRTPYYRVSAKAESGGTISYIPTEATSGSTVRIHLAPDPGYVVDRVYISYRNNYVNDNIDVILQGVGNERSFVMPPSPVFIMALFTSGVPSTYSIQTSTSAGGKIVVQPSVAQQGEIINVEIIPDDGYVVSEFAVNSGRIVPDGTDNMRTFTMPPEDVQIWGSFRKAEQVEPSESAQPSSAPTATPTASPAATSSPSESAPPTAIASALPAPSVPVIDGYGSGFVNGRNYYVKISGSSTMFYLRNASGKMERVAVPYVKDSSGKRWYPVNHGGTALFPRFEDDKVTCYCIYQDSMEIPVLNVSAVAAPEITDGYQTGVVGNRAYYVKVSGSSLMFYLRNAASKMERVAVPYVKDSTGKRWYPVNHGGTALFPVLENGKISSYTTGSGEAVLLEA